MSRAKVQSSNRWRLYIKMDSPRRNTYLIDRAFSRMSLKRRNPFAMPTRSLGWNGSLPNAKYPILFFLFSKSASSVHSRHLILTVWIHIVGLCGKHQCHLTWSRCSHKDNAGTRQTSHGDLAGSCFARSDGTYVGVLYYGLRTIVSLFLRFFR